MADPKFPLDDNPTSQELARLLLLRADEEKIALHTAHLGGPGNVAFKVLVDENSGIM
jgi:hypothetical protein